MSDVSWDPPDPQRTWHLSAWTEPTPVPMLEREILTRFTAGFKRCVEEAGSGFRQDAVCFVNGYCYMATSALSEEEVSARRNRHLEHLAQLEAKGTSVYEAEVRPRLEARLEVVRRGCGRARDRPALVDALTAAMDAATDAMGNWHWRMSSTPFDWKATYVEITGRRESEASTLLQGVGHATATLVRRLRALARVAQTDPALRDVVERGDVGSLDRFPAFADDFSKLLRDHGRRTGYGLGSNVNFHTPTWSMRPGMVLKLIGGYARSDLDAVEAAERRAKRQRTSLARRVRAALAEDPARLDRFEAAHARAISDVRRSENSNHLIEQETMGSMRQSIDAVGRFMVERGVLDAPDDVFHLTLDELSEVDETSMRSLVEHRKLEQGELSRLAAPTEIGMTPPPRPPEAPAPQQQAADSRGDVVLGVGVAGGNGRGRARIALATAEPPDVDPGDVLVARDAGPAWTPVFPIVAAIVLDGGDIADHAAIMARDLGIPAVMRTGNATTVISEGSWVVVDGDEGTVSIER